MKFQSRGQLEDKQETERNKKKLSPYNMKSVNFIHCSSIVFFTFDGDFPEKFQSV